MLFICEESCIDSGIASRLNSRNLIETHNYKAGHDYNIPEPQLIHLTKIGLFPEFFAVGNDDAQRWLDENNDRLVDLVEGRELPYRKLTADEELNDILVEAGKKAGTFTLPHGTRGTLRVKLRPKGQSFGMAAMSQERSPLEAPPRPVELKTRKKTAKTPDELKAERQAHARSMTEKRKAKKQAAAAAAGV